MNKVRGGAPSQRQRRVSEEIRHALSLILERDMPHDPDLSGVSITITEVRSSPDLRHATVFFTPLGGMADGAVVRSALVRFHSILRRAVAQRVQLKYVPRFSFEVDTRFEEYERVSDLLNQPRVLRDTHPLEESVLDDDLPQGEGFESDSSDEDGPLS